MQRVGLCCEHQGPSYTLKREEPATVFVWPKINNIYDLTVDLTFVRPSLAGNMCGNVIHNDHQASSSTDQVNIMQIYGREYHITWWTNLIPKGLLDSVSKILKWVIYNRLLPAVEDLRGRQIGFGKATLTIDAQSDCWLDWESNNR